jgi:hypothetical protein
MTHKFGYYNAAMKKASRNGVKLAMQLFKMKLGPYVVQFGSHVTHAELMALDMFTKPIQAQVKEYNLGVEKNLDIIEEVLERDTNMRSYAALNNIFNKRTDKTLKEISIAREKNCD